MTTAPDEDVPGDELTDEDLDLVDGGSGPTIPQGCAGGNGGSCHIF